MPRQTEPNANNALGSLLQDMLPRGQVRSENTRAISGHPRAAPRHHHCRAGPQPVHEDILPALDLAKRPHGRLECPSLGLMQTLPHKGPYVGVFATRCKSFRTARLNGPNGVARYVLRSPVATINSVGRSTAWRSVSNHSPTRRMKLVSVWVEPWLDEGTLLLQAVTMDRICHANHQAETEGRILR